MANYLVWHPMKDHMGPISLEMLRCDLQPIVQLNLWDLEFVRQGELHYSVSEGQVRVL